MTKTSLYHIVLSAFRTNIHLFYIYTVSLDLIFLIENKILNQCDQTFWSNYDVGGWYF